MVQPTRNEFVAEYCRRAAGVVGLWIDAKSHEHSGAAVKKGRDQQSRGAPMYELHRRYLVLKALRVRIAKTEMEVWRRDAHGTREAVPELGRDRVRCRRS
jgi:hypothetical protein